MSRTEGLGLSTPFRVGLGYDSHCFDDARPLILGGILVPNHAGLTGHSDGDAVAHAVIDAILGAAAAGNVGSLFPPTDEQWRGADSVDLLARAAAVVGELGYRVVNVDVTVVCESPRIAPYSGEMAARLAAAMAVSPGQVSIKGKTNEGMGWIGAGEGIAVHAAALVETARP